MSMSSNCVRVSTYFFMSKFNLLIVFFNIFKKQNLFSIMILVKQNLYKTLIFKIMNTTEAIKPGPKPKKEMELQTNEDVSLQIPNLNTLA